MAEYAKMKKITLKIIFWMYFDLVHLMTDQLILSTITYSHDWKKRDFPITYIVEFLNDIDTYVVL